MEDSLEGRRILITRTRGQASALAFELEQLGATPIVIPTIEIAPPTSSQELDNVLADIEAFDWLVFTSANAVHAFVRRAQMLGRVVMTAQVAVIGPATEQAVRASDVFSSVQTVLIPPVAVGESLAATLLPHVNHLLARGHAARLALVRADIARDTLPEILAAAGASVTIAPAYRNVLPTSSATLLRQIFEEPSRMPEAVTFTSSSTAVNFVELLAATGLRLPPSVLRISIGPITSATLRDLNLAAHTEAANPSIASLVDAVRRAFHALEPAA